MLYSYKRQLPSRLPDKIVLSDGTTRTDSSTFSEEELRNAGYIVAPTPPPVLRSQKLQWNGTDWVVSEKTLADKDQEWVEIRKICLKLLKDTDFKVLKAYEAGIPVSQGMSSYRQALRDLYNNVSNQDPWDIVWPILKE